MTLFILANMQKTKTVVLTLKVRKIARKHCDIIYGELYEYIVHIIKFSKFNMENVRKCCHLHKV